VARITPWNWCIPLGWVIAAKYPHGRWERLDVLGLGKLLDIGAFGGIVHNSGDICIIRVFAIDGDDMTYEHIHYLLDLFSTLSLMPSWLYTQLRKNS